MTVTLLVMTDGRRSCISRTIPSALTHLHGPITSYIICDDSADSDYQRWLNYTFPEFDIVGGNERVGFGGNIRRAWEYIIENCATDWVFHVEDDFTFNRDIELQPMIDVLEHNPHLVQLVLRRQPWNEEERMAGGIVEQHPDAYVDRHDDLGNDWLEHRLFYSTNPSLYRSALCYEPWPDVDHSEGIFTYQLLAKDPNIRFGFWGSRQSGEAVCHIGLKRVGSGY